ncbi:MAG TPA: NADP-dependent oxidoreductase [Bacteroidota bacterium]|nr:NADP-dependent oxidoreductase [Bacteroidota bacterium]
MQAIAEHIKLQSGQKILIQGGSGGIGVFATALAKHLGAYVATTVSGASADYANEIGADEVIDYKTQDFSTILSDYDAVFDLVGSEVYEKSFKVLKKGGILVSTVAQANNELADTHGVTTLTQQTMVNTRRLNELAKLVQDGVIKVKIDSIFPLAQISQAFIKQESGGVRGKVVVEVKK